MKAASKLGDDFKKFAFKGNIVDMAVGVVVGSAFTAIVTSLVSDIITPLISIITGDVNYQDLYVILNKSKLAAPIPDGTPLADAQALGAVTLNYGNFINAIISFFLIAISVFAVVMIIKNANVKARKAEAAAAAKAAEEAEKAAAEAAALKKICPFCQTEIHVNATRCPHCTSELDKE
ncbi:MAG: large conductance mechanosensitive channel protein MscL [Clostridia bacterium]|nr:large conductance mechanosensitive channel protein MscL [Clostridia bacterium]